MAAKPQLYERFCIRLLWFCNITFLIWTIIYFLEPYVTGNSNHKPSRPNYASQGEHNDRCFDETHEQQTQSPNLRNGSAVSHQDRKHRHFGIDILEQSELPWCSEGGDGRPSYGGVTTDVVSTLRRKHDEAREQRKSLLSKLKRESLKGNAQTLDTNEFFQPHRHLIAVLRSPEEAVRECGGIEDECEQLECLRARRNLSRQKWATRTDVSFMDGVHRLIDFSSVLDFGSGTGAYLRIHFNAGKAPLAVGIEPSWPYEAVAHYTTGWDFAHGPVHLHGKWPEVEPELDTLTRILFGNGTDGRYDLVQSLEVLEHVPRAAHCEVLNFIASRAKRYVLFSQAAIHQKGMQHIANRDQRDILLEFLRRGLTFEWADTIAIREGAAAPMFQVNPLLFSVTKPVETVKCATDKPVAPWQNLHDGNVIYERTLGMQGVLKALAPMVAEARRSLPPRLFDKGCKSFGICRPSRPVLYFGERRECVAGKRPPTPLV